MHHSLLRHGIRRLPRSEEKDSKRKRFDGLPIGYVHIDSGELHMFLAIDRVTKLNGAAFLQEGVAALPYRMKLGLWGASVSGGCIGQRACSCTCGVDGARK